MTASGDYSGGNTGRRTRTDVLDETAAHDWFHPSMPRMTPVRPGMPGPAQPGWQSVRPPYAATALAERTVAGGSDNPFTITTQDVLDVLGGQAGPLDVADDPGEGPFGVGDLGALVGAVDLLGDVGQVEVGREGPHEQRGGLEVQARQHRVQLGRGGLRGHVARRLGQRPHLLDEGEQLRALVAQDRLAQQIAEQPDVAPQAGALEGVSRGDCRACPAACARRGPQ